MRPPSERIAALGALAGGATTSVTVANLPPTAEARAAFARGLEGVIAKLDSLEAGGARVGEVLGDLFARRRWSRSRPTRRSANRRRCSSRWGQVLNSRIPVPVSSRLGNGRQRLMSYFKT